ncbi:hypothetical protein D3C73_728540 [compost metagenome]
MRIDRLARLRVCQRAAIGQQLFQFGVTVADGLGPVAGIAAQVIGIGVGVGQFDRHAVDHGFIVAAILAFHQGGPLHRFQLQVDAGFLQVVLHHLRHGRVDAQALEHHHRGIEPVGVAGFGQQRPRLLDVALVGVVQRLVVVRRVRGCRGAVDGLAMTEEGGLGYGLAVDGVGHRAPHAGVVERLFAGVEPDAHEGPARHVDLHAGVAPQDVDVLPGHEINHVQRSAAQRIDAGIVAFDHAEIDGVQIRLSRHKVTGVAGQAGAHGGFVGLELEWAGAVGGKLQVGAAFHPLARHDGRLGQGQHAQQRGVGRRFFNLDGGRVHNRNGHAQQVGAQRGAGGRVQDAVQRELHVVRGDWRAVLEFHVRAQVEDDAARIGLVPAFGQARHDGAGLVIARQGAV